MPHDQSFHFMIGHTAIILTKSDCLSDSYICLCEKRRGAAFLPHLDHVELGDAVLLHTHGHGDAVLFDEHCDTLVVRIKQIREKTGKGNGDRKDGERWQEWRGSYWWLVKLLAEAHIDGSCRENKTKAYKRWIDGWIPPTCIIFTLKTHPPEGRCKKEKSVQSGNTSTVL